MAHKPAFFVELPTLRALDQYLSLCTEDDDYKMVAKAHSQVKAAIVELVGVESSEPPEVADEF